MEKRFRVYVYEEGEPPLLHQGPCKNVYTIEGRFIEQLELLEGGRGVRTTDPERANAFFLPFSVTQMVTFTYSREGRRRSHLRRARRRLRSRRRGSAPLLEPVHRRRPLHARLPRLGQYCVQPATAGCYYMIFRSMSCGFLMILLAYMQGPYASQGHPELYANSIRALCNANTSEGFRPAKDVSVPEIYLYDGDMPRQLLEPAPPAGVASRPFLAFFAGGKHGHTRDVLLRHWKGLDPDVFPVYEYDLPKGGRDYYSFMRAARFCLCPSGHEVASARVVEAIHAECVPVIVSEGYALPFADVLRWEAFSVVLPLADVPRLREVLEQIPAPEVERLQRGVRLVKRHFLLHQPPERLDMFSMILHSVWLRRLNVRLDR
ncbi:hypothetical protein HU200_023634 [Digitaria exilis]|uniref:Exostosin GT47 domain-containing protein n=1 Tax=Digitaria exilis TaxID=1010633 RepID=A0A835BZT8_9POAL|nr:hypothetical protein HU200_023634 [Digitaria exilis]